MTTIKTAKTSYTVMGIDCPATGPTVIKVKTPSGKLRKLTVADVGRPRFDSAVAHYLHCVHAEEPFIRPVGCIPDRVR